LEKEKHRGDRRVKGVRHFWRDQVFEQHTRGGMMLMALARGEVSQLNDILMIYLVQLQPHNLNLRRTW
jgi:hypothetical protein